MIGYLLFETVKGKKDIGSSRLRGHWMVKYWDEAEVFKIGKKYDGIVFQKVYWPEYARIFPGIKVLDICDPDWLFGEKVKEMIDQMDAVTCPTERFKEFLSDLTDKPVVVIPDRQDLEYCKEKKIHKGKAKKCVWFGYKHNAHVLKQTLPFLEELGLELTIITEDYITVCDYGWERFKKYEHWKKWNLKTVGAEIIKNDIVLMPISLRPSDQYKSNNKITYAWALRMPVAQNYDELKRYLDPVEREKAAEKGLREVKERYDIRQSVEQMKGLFDELKRKKETEKAM